MADLKFTFQEKLSEVKREIAMRKNVYPSFVARGKLTQEKADRHIAVMSAIADDYERAINRDAPTQSKEGETNG